MKCSPTGHTYGFIANGDMKDIAPFIFYLVDIIITNGCRTAIAIIPLIDCKYFRIRRLI